MGFFKIFSILSPAFGISFGVCLFFFNFYRGKSPFFCYQHLRVIFFVGKLFPLTLIVSFS